MDIELSVDPSIDNVKDIFRDVRLSASTTNRAMTPFGHIQNNHPTSIIGEVQSRIMIRKNERLDCVKMIDNVC